MTVSVLKSAEAFCLRQLCLRAFSTIAVAVTNLRPSHLHLDTMARAVMLVSMAWPYWVSVCKCTCPMSYLLALWLPKFASATTLLTFKLMLLIVHLCSGWRSTWWLPGRTLPGTQGVWCRRRCLRRNSRTRSMLQADQLQSDCRQCWETKRLLNRRQHQWCRRRC